MVSLPASSKSSDSIPSKDYLDSGECIVIVDDSMEIIIIFENLLKKEGFQVFSATSVAELYKLLDRKKIALILLDIGLPDQDGTEILGDLVTRHPDLGIIMLTGTTNLQVVLACLREGADDYLAKPVSLEEFSLAVRKTLQKRRLIIDNRNYQKQLELTNYRTRFLHKLNLKMNSAYLNSIELKTVLHSILTGITAEEGLKFNRAFLLLFNKNHSILQGKMGIGPPCKADAGRVWSEIKEKDLHLSDILDSAKSDKKTWNNELNEIVGNLTVSANDHEHVLIRACDMRISILVQNGRANDHTIPSELLNNLQENNFIITPLFSPKKSLGVLIADNFVTNRPISTDDINSLEIFANQASLAIEHSRLYQDMTNKISELEEVTRELEASKDLLVNAERYSAIGQMSAQLAHAIRNPLTTIGGTARLLARKTEDENTLQFLNMMISEAGRIESTIEDLFNYVEDKKPEKILQHLYPLIHKSIALFYSTMKKQFISHILTLPSPDPELPIDSKLFRQMLTHLFKNGIEAMPSGGILTISCENTAEKVQISIRDSGSGITNSNIKRATDPFYTTKTYGTGMGLTLVEKIIAEHDGRFSLERGNDGGMVALIILPGTAL